MFGYNLIWPQLNMHDDAESDTHRSRPVLFGYYRDTVSQVALHLFLDYISFQTEIREVSPKHPTIYGFFKIKFAIFFWSSIVVICKQLNGL